MNQLSATPYFDARLHRYSENLQGAISLALGTVPSLPDVVLSKLAALMWRAHQYLAGSISREAPYEVKLCLSRALSDWIQRDCLITTALVDEPHAFHFLTVDPWLVLKHTVPGFQPGTFDPILVLVGVPRLYKHKPLFCSPLYHELGHFIDAQFAITDRIMLSNPPQSGVNSHSYRAHWAEYFADLFSACYIGLSSVQVLEAIAPNKPVSFTHPATADRVDLVSKFLSGQSDFRIDAINNALDQAQRPNLVVRHTIPDITADFDDIRPYRVKTNEELHGLYAAAWNYFESGLTNRGFPWATAALLEDQIEKTVNDLVEKSIRNFSTREMWDRAASHP